VILDERFNHGGQIADYVIDYLKRKPMSIIASRDGRLIVDPPLAIYGPKVMLINQFAGSGGDALPWYFRKAELGPLVGVRTWGGLVGIGGYPTLIDGGTVTAPRTAIGGLHGRWEVEGIGIPPDVMVTQDPHAVREGHDPQLEAAVAKAMQLLRDHPIPTYRKPPYPDHHPVLPPPGD
jgi:tricorn protease